MVTYIVYLLDSCPLLSPFCVSSQIGKFLLHFWRGMPQHLASVLDHRGILDLIAYCDHITYLSIRHVLILTPLQNVPDRSVGQVEHATPTMCFHSNVCTYMTTHAVDLVNPVVQCLEMVQNKWRRTITVSRMIYKVTF